MMNNDRTEIPNMKKQKTGTISEMEYFPFQLSSFEIKMLYKYKWFKFWLKLKKSIKDLIDLIFDWLFDWFRIWRHFNNGITKRRPK